MVDPRIQVRNLSIAYGNRRVLEDVTLDVHANEILGIIGPANSGKTSFLNAINRMDKMRPDMRITGSILINGIDTRAWRNLYALRRRIGVVFPLPVGLPLTVYDNVALAPRLAGTAGSREDLDERVERCLRRAALWDEVKDRLHHLGSLLSGGQQQRLTIARALSQSPEILMLDEFSIAVDPVTTMRIEEALKTLKTEMTIILVTNLVQQAHRLADRTAFFLNGALVEVGVTEPMFHGQTRDPRTSDYIEGKFG
ncbi:MAG: phosphate ABC transporter ATP-binding protein [Magnetococcales bacterium]|nr:phosphate ABC transporter ATP-binding protein [Magnetococcales bacterium]